MIGSNEDARCTTGRHVRREVTVVISRVVPLSGPHKCERMTRVGHLLPIDYSLIGRYVYATRPRFGVRVFQPSRPPGAFHRPAAVRIGLCPQVTCHPVDPSADVGPAVTSPTVPGFTPYAPAKLGE